MPYIIHLYELLNTINIIFTIANRKSQIANRKSHIFNIVAHDAMRSEQRCSRFLQMKSHCMCD